MTDEYEVKVKQIKRLIHECKYSEATEKMRSLSCGHLINLGLEFQLEEQGLISYCSNEPCLFTSEEEFGERKAEERKKWLEDSKLSLKRLYKCELTENDCIAKKAKFRASDIASGDYASVFVELDHQRKCPVYQTRK
jgi:hypothetical protein